MEISSIYYESPIGLIQITEEGRYITSIGFIEDELKQVNQKTSKLLLECASQLEEYFAKKRKEFTIPLQPEGTDFQKKVWNQLIEIPYRKTISYSQQSKIMDNPKAIRAIASANGKNPISILIPCHRVIGSDGQLTGYAGGLWRKKFLLDLEQDEAQQKLF